MDRIETNADFRLGHLRIRTAEQTISSRSEVCRVSPRAMKVLVYLFHHRNRVISSDELLEKFWSPLASQHTIYKVIAELRSAMGDSVRQQRFIRTFPKCGYKLEVPDVNEPENSLLPMLSMRNKLLGFSLRALFAFNRSALRNQ